MSEELRRENESLRAEVNTLRANLEAARQRGTRALVGYQQQAIANEVMRQQKEELEELSQALSESQRVADRRARELEATNTELGERSKENAQLIERLRALVRQLSTPVLKVWTDVLALPVVGTVDEARAQEMMESTLTSIVQARARYLIVDVTGVDDMNASTAEHVIRLAGAVRMLGARCILSGIRPQLAQAVAELQLLNGEFDTVQTLHDALAVALRQRAPDRRHP
jgi:rsbT co-antagonist protein RsbR